MGVWCGEKRGLRYGRRRLEAGADEHPILKLRVNRRGYDKRGPAAIFGRIDARRASTREGHWRWVGGCRRA